MVWSRSVKKAATRTCTTRPLTSDEWVRRLNALARQMDELCEGIHPSTWHELTGELRTEFRRLAQMPTQDPPEQLGLFATDAT